MIVAFVGLHNNTTVYAQYQIRIIDTSIRQKIPVSERYRYWISDRRTPTKPSLNQDAFNGEAK